MDVIFTQGGGRFANQLFNEFNLAAFELEHVGEVNCLSLPMMNYTYFDYLPSLNSWKIKLVYVLQKIINRVPKRYQHRFKLSDRLIHCLHKSAYQKQNKKSYACHVLYDETIAAEKTEETNLNKLAADKTLDTVVLAGWPIRCWDLVEKHADKLRQKFVLKPEYRLPAEAAINEIRNAGYQKIIALQVRHEDYKEFMNGQYYFPASEYIRFAEDLVPLIYPNEKVALILTSNSPQPPLSSNLPLFIGPGDPLGPVHYVADLNVLALCDLIIAPPSTFSASASFLGQVPCLPLLKMGQIADPKDIMQSGLFDALKDPVLSLVIA